MPAGRRSVHRWIGGDWRALSTLFWSHLNLYGRFELDLSEQLDLGPGPGAEGMQSDGPL
ncbi:transposase [Nonomuraea polychroma]|uniref:transposase n=1 Tax=Nonomuraea polychroma TaxID=46176 RepID=UPI0013E3418A|nr:transposase [Nonomuraea polychroma]